MFADPEQAIKVLQETLGNENCRVVVSLNHYTKSGNFKIIVVIPNSRNGVYFGPHSTHPEDEETLISYKFFLRGLKKYEKDGILYILAEELPRK